MESNSGYSWIKDGIKWVLLYFGIYLGGPILASGILYTFSGIGAQLSADNGHAVSYMGLGMLLQAILGFGLIYGLILHPEGESWKELGFIKPKQHQFVRYMVGGEIVLLGGVFLFSVLLNSFFPDMGEQYFETLVKGSAGGIQQAVLVGCGCFLAPLMEEMLFRGVLYRGLKKYMNARMALLLASLVFGAIHMDGIRLLPLTFGGAVLCWIYEKTHCLWLNIIVHGLWNGIMMLLVL